MVFLSEFELVLNINDLLIDMNPILLANLNKSIKQCFQQSSFLAHLGKSISDFLTTIIYFSLNNTQLLDGKINWCVGGQFDTCVYK